MSKLTKDSKCTVKSYTFGGSVFVEDTERNLKILRLRRKDFMEKLQKIRKENEKK